MIKQAYQPKEEILNYKTSKKINYGQNYNTITYN